MNNDINLLTGQNAHVAQKEKSKKKVFEFLSYGVLFLIAASSVMLFILASFSPINKLRQEESDLLVQLENLRPEIGKHFIIKERSQSIQEVIAKRNTYDLFLKDIIGELPEEVGINSFVLADTDLTVRFLSSSLSSIDLYLVKLQFLAKERKYKDMKIENLVFEGEQGTYLLSVNFTRSNKQ